MQSVIHLHTILSTPLSSPARGEKQKGRRGEVLRGDTSLLALRDPNAVSPRGPGHDVGARCGPTAP